VPRAVRVSLDRDTDRGKEIVVQPGLVVRPPGARPRGAAVVGIAHDDVTLVASRLRSARGDSRLDAVVTGGAARGLDERQAQVIGARRGRRPYDEPRAPRGGVDIAAERQPRERILTAEDPHGVKRVRDRVTEEDVAGAGGGGEREVIQ